MKRTILFGALAAVFAAACFLAPGPGGIAAFRHSEPEGTAMKSTKGNGPAPRSAEIPPIDASRPNGTETATFALG